MDNSEIVVINFIFNNFIKKSIECSDIYGPYDMDDTVRTITKYVIWDSILSKHSSLSGHLEDILYYEDEDYDEIQVLRDIKSYYKNGIAPDYISAKLLDELKQVIEESKQLVKNLYLVEGLGLTDGISYGFSGLFGLWEPGNDPLVLINKDNKKEIFNHCDPIPDNFFSDYPVVNDVDPNSEDLITIEDYSGEEWSFYNTGIFTILDESVYANDCRDILETIKEIGVAEDIQNVLYYIDVDRHPLFVIAFSTYLHANPDTPRLQEIDDLP